ncbi:MAG: HindVP family restriction endonuclease [Paludibacteraceae bacterium]|nr:HindVP family restriction endonuclease [Paludibacteraceae bacterium]
MTKKIQPSLFGITNSNRDYTLQETWGKNMFNSSFPAALVAYMYSKKVDCVYIRTNKDNNIEHSKISVDKLFGISPLDKNTFYAFESVYAPFQQFYKGTIPRIDLVVQNKKTGVCTSGLEIKLTALPDNSTCDLNENEYSCELVIRPDTISYLACSISQHYLKRKAKLAEIMSDFAKIKHWDNEREIIKNFGLFVNFMDDLAKMHCEKQSALVLQPVWKTEGKSSRLSENCLDAFVWSDLALTHLFTGYFMELPTRIGRTERTLVWLSKMLYEFVQTGQFNAAEIIDKLSFNTKNDKAFSVAGKSTYPLLKCKELTKPRIKKNEIRNIILGGGQNLLSPERRFDAIIYNSPELFV